MDPLLMERSRSASTSSRFSSISNQSDSTGTNELTSNYSEIDNELAEAANALGILRSGSITSTPSTTNSNQLQQQPPPLNTTSTSTFNSNRTIRSDPSRSASITSTGSWSQSGPSTSTGATSPTGYSSIVDGSEVAEDEEEVLDPKFMARVSQLPIVSGGLEWYERSKASSRVVKYGAGLVESSFTAVSRPLANNLQLGSLDEFACRQLDRLGASGGGGNSPGEVERRGSIEGEDRNNGFNEMNRGRQNFDATTRREGSDGIYPRAGELVPMVTDKRTESPARLLQEQTVIVASRSRWQTVLVEAGGLGAAVSEESLKSLRYCLQWLLYATAHLDHQITVLRDFILSLQRHYGADARADALASASASAHLVQIKHDVVDTIRKVVEVVSKYAGAALPEQAKKYVRQSILGLPVKWASAVEGARSERRGSVSSAGTPRPERMEDPRIVGEKEDENSTETEAETLIPSMNPVLRPTEDAAERVLTFAVESLDMLKSVTQIFGESVEKAEAWIERLRIVGLDRQRQRQAARSASPPPPPSDSTGTKRRRGVPRETHHNGDVPSSNADMVGLDGEEGLTRRKKGARSRGGDLAGPSSTNNGMEL